MVSRFPFLNVFAWAGLPILISCSSRYVSSKPLPMHIISAYEQSEQLLVAGINSQRKATQLSRIGVPITFQVTLQGETEGGAFSDIGAVVEIKPAVQPDPNPMLISVYPTETNFENLAMGHFFWQSYTVEIPTANEHYSCVTVDGDQVQMVINPSDTLRSDVMWFTQVTGTLANIPGMQGRSGRIGATGQSGSMTFRIEDNSISGTISLSGTSDLGSTSRYKATFSGLTL